MNYLTAEQMMVEVENYCRSVGNESLGINLRNSFNKDGKLPMRAVKKSLGYEAVTMYRKIETND